MEKILVDKSINLTNREKEVLYLIVKGYSNPEIASKIVVNTNLLNL